MFILVHILGFFLSSSKFQKQNISHSAVTWSHMYTCVWPMFVVKGSGNF